MAKEYYGIDYSKEAINYLQSVSSSIHCACADVMEITNPFEKNSFDVVVVSHTIEHLEEAHKFLDTIYRIGFSYLVAEVPLENLFFGKVKAMLKDRSKNVSGHVQFFTKKSFRKLIGSSNYTVLDDWLYAPSFDFETIRSAYTEQGSARYIQKMLMERYLPKITSPLWKRIYHAHYAVLCKKS